MFVYIKISSDIFEVLVIVCIKLNLALIYHTVGILLLVKCASDDHVDQNRYEELCYLCIE